MEVREKRWKKVNERGSGTEVRQRGYGTKLKRRDRCCFVFFCQSKLTDTNPVHTIR